MQKANGGYQLEVIAKRKLARPGVNQAAVRQRRPTKIEKLSLINL